MRKNEAWLEHTTPQGDAFYALCHEAGGRLGDSAYDFLGMIIDGARPPRHLNARVSALLLLK